MHSRYRLLFCLCLTGTERVGGRTKHRDTPTYTRCGNACTRVSAPGLGTSLGIASAGHTEDSPDAAFLKKYYSGKTLNEYLKSMSEIKFIRPQS